MAKIEVTVDEKWPLFSLTEPKSGGEDFQFDLPDEMYKDYLYIMYKFNEFQIKLGLLYQDGNRKLSERCCGRRFPEGSGSHEQYEFNTTRNCPTETPV